MTLEQIIMASLDAEIEEYEKALCNLPEPVFSPNHNRIMSKAIRVANSNMKAERNYKNARPIKIKHIFVAALIAIFAIMSSTIAFAIVYPEYYMVIKEKVKEWTINFTTDDESISSGDFVIRRAETPNGFMLSSEVVDDGIYTAIYNSEEDKELVYVQQEISLSTVTGLDSENDYKKVEKINGTKTIVMKKDDCYTLFWVENNCSYTLIGNCDLKILKQYMKEIK